MLPTPFKQIKRCCAVHHEDFLILSTPNHSISETNLKSHTCDIPEVRKWSDQMRWLDQWVSRKTLDFTQQVGFIVITHLNPWSFAPETIPGKTQAPHQKKELHEAFLPDHHEASPSLISLGSQGLELVGRFATDYPFKLVVISPLKKPQFI